MESVVTLSSSPTILSKGERGHPNRKPEEQRNGIRSYTPVPGKAVECDSTFIAREGKILKEADRDCQPAYNFSLVPPSLSLTFPSKCLPPHYQ